MDRKELDILIKDAIKDVYNIDSIVKLQGKEIDNIVEENSDPFEDLFKLAEQNQIIFNFED